MNRLELIADAFLNALRREKECPHMVVMFGDEPYFKKAVEKALREKAFPKGMDCNEWNFKGDFALSALQEAVNEVPFFGGQNWVMIEDPRLLEAKPKEKNENKKAGSHKKRKVQTPMELFVQILSDVPEYTYVLCSCEKLDKRQSFYKTMSKKAVVADCSSLKPYPNQLQPWLRSQADKMGARLDDEAMNLILEYVSSSDRAPLLFLQQELQKLALYAGKRKIWTAEDVKQMFSQLPEISGFALGNAVGEGRLDKVLQLLAEEKKNSGDSGFYPLLARICSTFRRMLQIKELQASGARQDYIVSVTKYHPFAVKKAMDYNSHYSRDALEKAYIGLGRTAMESRQGGRTWPRLEEVLVEFVGSKRY